MCWQKEKLHDIFLGYALPYIGNSHFILNRSYDLSFGIKMDDKTAFSGEHLNGKSRSKSLNMLKNNFTDQS